MDAEPTANRRRDHRRPYEVVQERLQAHPGYVEYLKIQAFAATIKNVFEANASTLVHLLDQTSTDRETAWEMVQNVGSPEVRNRIVGLVNCSLHNYVASAMTLVDHSRRLMRGRTGPLVDEYEERKRALLQNPEVPFIQDLRNMSLHRSLPLLAHTVTFTGGGQSMESEVELDTADLLRFNDWSPGSKQFIREHGNRIQLRPVVRRHAKLVYEINAWLITQLQEANSSLLAEANEIVVEMNAAMAGVDIETARQMTDEHSARTYDQARDDG